LFHKIILASGSATNDWAFTPPAESVRFSKEMALRLGASEEEVEDSTKTMAFLRDSLENQTVLNLDYHRQRKGVRRFFSDQSS